MLFDAIELVILFLVLNFKKMSLFDKKIFKKHLNLEQYCQIWAIVIKYLATFGIYYEKN